MEPKWILPDATRLATRRCAQRQFLMRPSEEVNGALLYCLARAAAATGVSVHAFVFLSNHYHVCLTDRGTAVVQFVHDLNLLIARCLNVHHGRRDAFFESCGPNYPRAVEASDVVDQLVYTMLNPVAARLVERGCEWPGLRSSPRDLGRVYVARRPNWFFSREAPEEVELPLTEPPCFRGREAELREVLAERVREGEREYRDEAKRSRRSFLGRERVLAEAATATPREAEEDAKKGAGGVAPEVKARRKWSRIEAITSLKTFRARYREALEKFRAGVRDVLFPAGTYRMRVFFNVACEPAESGAVPLAP